MNATMKKKEKKVIKTICILQITRIGDLIQTCQACDTLKKEHPKTRLILIAREQFARPLHFLTKNIFDKVYLIGTQTFFNKSSEQSLENLKNNLKIFLNQFESEQISVLVNLSFSKSSGFLSSMISAKFKLGLIYDTFGKISISDKWSQFIYSNVLGSSLCAIQLVDLYKTIIGVSHHYRPINQKNSHLNMDKDRKKSKSQPFYYSKPDKKDLSLHTIDAPNWRKEIDHYIVVHPFASQERKRWKGSKWSEVLYKIIKDNPSYKILMTGAKNEFKNSQSIINSQTLYPVKHKIINIVGKTSLEELYSILESSDLFIGHDSMVGHLAAYHKTPTITISLGTVRPYETTPYHKNAYNFSPMTKCFPCFLTDKCPDYKCHTDIPFQLIGPCINRLLSKKPIDSKFLKESISPFHLSSVDIRKTTFTKDGLCALESLNNAILNIKEIFRIFYRYAWRYYLSEKEEALALPQLNSLSYENLLNYTKGIEALFELCGFGQKYSQYILEEVASQKTDLHKIKDFSGKIDEIDRLQSLIKNTFPLLAPIIDYFTIVKGNLKGKNIVELTENSYMSFENNAYFCRIIYELIEQTLTNHQQFSQNKNLSEKSTRA